MAKRKVGRPAGRKVDPFRNNKLDKEWKRLVKERDGHKCQMPGCNSTHSLQVHHIQKWANALHLRHIVANGITLCFKCHKNIWGKEDHWMGTFMRIVAENSKNPIPPKPRERKTLTTEEILFLQKNGPNMTLKEITEMFDVKERTVRWYMLKINVKYKDWYKHRNKGD